MARRKIRFPVLQFLTALSWIPVLYFPLAVIGLLLAAVGWYVDSAQTAGFGLQLTMPAVFVTFVILALLAFSGLLNALLYLIRCVRRAIDT